ncbi:MAG: UvrD-helicase domain-containing protein, partial [Arachnia sp.]
MRTTPEWILREPSQYPRVQITQAQRLAASEFRGLRLVLGGPGTGKTTTVVGAVTGLVARGQPLSEIAVVSSSRAAAQRLRRTIATTIGRAHTSPRVTTIHGFALAVMHDVMAEPVALLRAPDQELRIHELLTGNPGRWPASVRDAVQTRSFARQLREVISRARQLSLDPEQLAHLASRHDDSLFGAVADFFEEYLTVSDFDGSLDYSELVFRTRTALRDDHVARLVTSRLSALVIDDAQELDAAQVGLVGDVAGLGIPVWAAADPLQRIGGFRGATTDAVARLHELAGSPAVHLGEGFRCQAAVADALISIRSRLDPRHSAPPATPAPGIASAVTARVYDDEGAESAQIAAELRAAVADEQLEWSDLAVIVRSAATQIGPLARTLTHYGIPVSVAGDELPLGDHHSVQVLLLALEVAAAGARPDGDAAVRLLSSPLGGVDTVGQRRLGRLLVATHPELGPSPRLVASAVCDPGLLDGLDTPETTAVRRLAAALRRTEAFLSCDSGIALALWELWESTGWPQDLRGAALAGNQRAGVELDGVVELFELAARRPDLSGPAGARAFVAEARGQELPADTGRESDVAPNAVRILTAHRSRSGQWRRVWLVGLREGSWPSGQRRGLLLDPDHLAFDALDRVHAPSLLAEERRLFYAACGRASERVLVSAPQGVEGEAGRPSRFLSELGVPVERVYGYPEERLSAPALIADLRRAVLGNGSQALRRAAAARLAAL